MKSFKFFFISLIITFSILASKNALAGGPGCGVFAPNDSCINATPLVLGNGCQNGTTCGDVEGGETLPSCDAGQDQTVWYSFVATLTAHTVVIENLLSGGCHFTTAVYSGACLPSTREGAGS